MKLRPIVIDDFQAWADLMASSRSKWVGGPFTLKDAWGIFCHEVANWHLFGHGGLAIELAATGECVGQVEINSGPLFPEPELGWQLYAEHERKGYATEAAQALRDWVFRETELNTLVSYIDPGNTRSIAVAERLGGIVDQLAPRLDERDLLFRYRR